MSTELDVTLETASLFSKWGFHDGDMPEHLMDWHHHHADNEGHTWYHAWHEALTLMVYERLLPALDADVDVFEIGTNHNPIRAKAINGTPFDDHYGEWSDYGITPDSVTVTFDDVLEYIRRAMSSEASA